MNSDFQNIGSFSIKDINTNADAISKAFDRVSKDISKSLENAAKSGSLSIKNLATSIIKDLQSIAINQYVTKPLNEAISNIGTNLSKSVLNYGSRAGGGAVNVGGAYLVGENGPEMFVPNSAGKIDNSIGQNINIHINMAQGSNLSDVKRSANQVSAALARAVNRGVGNL